jgi:hypothetical protein
MKYIRTQYFRKGEQHYGKSDTHIFPVKNTEKTPKAEIRKILFPESGKRNGQIFFNLSFVYWIVYCIADSTFSIQCAVNRTDKIKNKT